MIDIDKTLMPWIGRSMKVIDYFIADRFSKRGIDLTKVQWLLLMRLEQINGESQLNLACFTNRDKASLTRIITTMEKKNLVARIPSKSDKRINHVFITSNGEKILKMARPVIEEMVEEMQTGLSEEERIVAIKVLKKLIYNIESIEQVALEIK